MNSKEKKRLRYLLLKKIKGQTYEFNKDIHTIERIIEFFKKDDDEEFTVCVNCYATGMMIMYLEEQYANRDFIKANEFKIIVKENNYGKQEFYIEPLNVGESFLRDV